MTGTLIPTFQARLTDALKSEGLIPMSAGVTAAVPTAGSYPGVFSTLSAQVDKAQATYGPRLTDRYSTSVGDSYRDQRFNLIAGFEGVKTRSYNDNGKMAVGLGFQMDSPQAKATWAQALGDSASFDDVRAGKATITPAQAKSLFEHDVLYAEKVVNQATGGRALTQNQRLALVSVAYNAPARVSSWGDTLKSGTTAQIQDLILHNSFNPNNPQANGLKQRRYNEASLFGNIQDSADTMPSFGAYNSSVQVDPKTGQADLIGRIVGHPATSVTGLHTEFQGRLENLFQAAPDSMKKDLGLISGYRTVAEQTKIWNDTLAKYHGNVNEARRWAAPPGKSAHNSGFAADMAYKGKSLASAPPDVVNWLHTNAPKFGLKFPLSNENWHIEPVETRQKGVSLANTVLIPRSTLKPIPQAPVPANKPATAKGNIFNGNDPLVTEFNNHFGAKPPASGGAKPTKVTPTYNELDAKADRMKGWDQWGDITPKDTRPAWAKAATTPGNAPGVSSAGAPKAAALYQTPPMAYNTVNSGSSSGSRPMSSSSAPSGQTIQGSSTGNSYVVGQTYSNGNGSYVAQANGTFKKI
ncbi:MAG: D-alanyl-D-alanine carboxypeptidase family protein [Devosia sp.]|nr:D-alanyl-D-alanine carboxypeptidase family protein [Devosia sp.]